MQITEPAHKLPDRQARDVAAAPALSQPHLTGAGLAQGAKAHDAVMIAGAHGART